MKPLPEVRPEAAGLDPTRVACVGRLVEQGIEQRLYLGAAWRIVRGGAVAAAGCSGLAQEGPAVPVGPDTVFDLASLTKPIATATSVMQLAERAAFHLEEEVTRFLPADASPALDGLTLRHLLTHTSGLPAWKKYHSRGLNRDAVLKEIRSQPRERPVGSRFVYSDLGFILLGEVIEWVAGQREDAYVREQILKPLELTATTYLPPETWAKRLAATHCPDRGRVLVGEVHDGNAASMGGVAGHAGLFGSVENVARFAAALLAGGRLDDARVLGPLTLSQMTANQLQPPVGSSGLGWFTHGNGMLPAGDFFPPDTFGHTGFTGTSLVISPSLDLGVVLLTNRVYMQRDAADFLRFRRRFHNAVAACVADPKPRHD